MDRSFNGPEVAALIEEPTARELRIGTDRGRGRKAYAVRLAVGLGVAAAALVLLGLAPRPRVLPSDGEVEDSVGLARWGKVKGHLAARFKRQRDALRAALLLKAQKPKYNETTARAFAAMSKLAYCGNLPGIYGTVSMSCSTLDLPGATSACERGGFEIVPGMVRTLFAEDEHVEESFFAYAAKVQTVRDEAAVKDGMVIVFRGSVDNFVNLKRDKNTNLEKGLEGCPSCRVHAGYHKVFRAMKESLGLILQEFACKPGECTIYVTGHGTGAAYAAINAWELAYRNYTIGTSYLFGMPQIGDAALAKAMTEKFTGKQGPIFQVTQGRDAVTRWPFNKAFKSWGIEVNYRSMSALAPQVCWAGRESCGVHQVDSASLTTKDHCPSPLAPDSDFCSFRDWSMQCYGGLGFRVVEEIHNQIPPNVTYIPLRQPDEQRAAQWHPAAEDGEQAVAVANSSDPKDYYNEKTLLAFGALEKIAYCTPTFSVRSVVTSTCRGGRGLCSKAGFGVVPNSVMPVYSEWNGTQDAFFFYTALLRRTEARFAEKPYFMPAESCVLVFRGTYNKANKEMNHLWQTVPLNDTDCPGCEVSTGIYTAWKEYGLEDNVLKALKSSGCEADPAKETTDKIYLVGHSMGGTMMTMASYFLTKLGFKVQLSWMLEAARPGNDAFMEYIYTKMLSKVRPVPFWHVTNKNDAVPRWPKSPNGLGRHRTQVFFNQSLSDYQICADSDENTPEGGCGMYGYEREELTFKLLKGPHCELPYAPGGQLCMPSMSCQWGTDIAR